jgi:hypothetical protein
MGQQSNKVQKRRRRLNYQKRKKVAVKVAAASKATGAPAKKPAEKTPVPAEA